jgi:hypothetical protein
MLAKAGCLDTWVRAGIDAYSLLSSNTIAGQYFMRFSSRVFFPGTFYHGPLTAVITFSLCAAFCCHSAQAQTSAVFEETGGLLAVEAEHFSEQTHTDVRAFYLTTAESKPNVTPDGDEAHVAGASGGAYLEVLPDTRRTHGDKLIKGTNFSPEPGKMAVLSYRVHFTTPGRYYVWARAYSTGSEDNGLHVGLDGEWPESGQRLQWCEGKRSWFWESKQRTEAEHCGEPHKIFLDIKQPGEHTIHFSMREDGFEFDKWLMTTDREFQRPDGVGPESQIHSGTAPATFPYIEVSQAAHEPEADPVADRGLVLTASSFPVGGSGYYLDKGKWLAVNPEKNKSGASQQTFPFPTGVYHVTLHAVGESDGRSTYKLSIDGEPRGDFQCPLSDQMFEQSPKFAKTFSKLQITEGAMIGVASEIASEDGQEFSRARWAAVAFEPADDPTLAAVKPYLDAQAASAADANRPTQGSPTTPVSTAPLAQPRGADGDGSVQLSGELKQWHKVTLTLNGPFAHEQDNAPNPFTDYRMQVTFTHADGTTYRVPAYFAADGDAANSSAESGNQWRAHLAPDRTGDWTYRVSFEQGDLAALEATAAAKALAPFDGVRGSFTVAPSDKSGRDLRALGQLRYIGARYLQFAGNEQYFLKVGADAPETLLGYADFDNTHAGKPQKVPLKTWQPHVRDWKPGDPTWKDARGKGLIGAVNYLAGKGCNAFSFLTYNAGGDGDNVWPFIHRDDKLHYDCSKLDQWGIVFDHATKQGMYLHFKMQETENDDHVRGKEGNYVAESLDGGNLGTQRKLYCRELIARYAHNLALNWNLGEENTQSTAQQLAMLKYIQELDAYNHNRVVHTFPEQQDKVYRPLLGDKSPLTGVSLQNSHIKDTHWQVIKWVEQSQAAGKPWVVAFDESGSAAHGQCPDIGYEGYDGRDRTGKMTYTEHEVRKQTLWGTLMGGGAGVEYYFGYQYVQNDLVCEDWRSRDRSWDYCRIAINFFSHHSVPFWDMQPRDELIGNSQHDNSRYCLANDQTFVIYLAEGGTTDLDLSGVTGGYQVRWFNPRTGGQLAEGSVQFVTGGSRVSLGSPPSEPTQDWVVLVTKR